MASCKAQRRPEALASQMRVVANLWTRAPKDSARHSPGVSLNHAGSQTERMAEHSGRMTKPKLHGVSVSNTLDFTHTTLLYDPRRGAFVPPLRVKVLGARPRQA